MVVPGETKMFKAGSTAPKLNSKRPTLFSYRFSPYSERVRLLLNVKHVIYDVINVDLTSKPEWFLERNPLGKLPTIEEPGKKPLFESLNLAEYLDEKYPGTKQVLPTDAYDKARQRQLIEIITQKFIIPFGGALFKSEVELLLVGLEEVEKLLTSKYFAGLAQGYVDLMIWPWFERLPAVAAIRGFEFSASRYPKLVAWTETMLSDPDVKATAYSTELIIKFFQSAAGGHPDGDTGLE